MKGMPTSVFSAHNFELNQSRTKSPCWAAVATPQKKYMVEAADIQGTYFVEFVKRIVLPRGGKSKQGKGKNGKKGSGKKEGYDLIVHIDLQEWKLSDDMVISPMFSFSLKCFFVLAKNID